MRSEISPQGAIPRVEDLRFVTGRGRYTADHHRQGEAVGYVVRSPHAHALVRDVDAGAARAMPGVVAVLTAEEMAADGLGTFPCLTQFEAVTPLRVPPHHALAMGRVRYVGEPVAFVVAESLAAAMDAAEAIDIDYEALDAVTDAEAALEAGAPELWQEAPGNLAFTFRKGDRAAVEAAMAGAAFTVSLGLVNNRVSALPLEPRAAIGEVDPATGALTLEVSGQGVHGTRDVLAQVLGVAPDTVRVFAEDVGGGFGLKNGAHPEHALVLWAARRLGRPVRWISTQSDELMGSVHGRAVSARACLALDETGRFLALDVAMVADAGAYASAFGLGATTSASSVVLGGVYDIPVIALESRGAFTNTAPIEAYRGAGKPEANYVLERLIDAAARRYGFDPLELRRRNVITTFPATKALGAVVDTSALAASIEAAAARADYRGFAARRAEAEGRGRLRGIGVACFLESARGAPAEEAGLRFAEDGTIEVVTGTESNGQGHETAFVQVAAARLGLPMEAFRFVQADTAATRMGNGHGGARSMHMGAGTLAEAVDAMLEAARPLAAQLLQAEPDQVSYADGTFLAAGRSVSLVELAAAARRPDVGPDHGLDTLVRREGAPFTFPSGCQIAEVEIDEGTGAVTLVAYVAVDDYGTIVNPMLAEGQVHGGLAQGIGQALGEAIVYDAGGQILSGSLMDYWLPRADDLPRFDVVLSGVPTEANRLGVKGSGQAGCIGAPPAVVHAVLNALAGLGVDDIQMPATAERVWRAIRDARAAG